MVVQIKSRVVWALFRKLRNQKKNQKIFSFVPPSLFCSFRASLKIQAMYSLVPNVATGCFIWNLKHAYPILKTSGMFTRGSGLIYHGQIMK